jgi:hypothetical protein
LDFVTYSAGASSSYPGLLIGRTLAANSADSVVFTFRPRWDSKLVAILDQASDGARQGKRARIYLARKAKGQENGESNDMTAL